jgi:hypothetical protein
MSAQERAAEVVDVLLDHLPQVERCETCGERREPGPGAPDGRWYAKHVGRHLAARGLLADDAHDRAVAARALREFAQEVPLDCYDPRSIAGLARARADRVEAGGG